MRSPYRKRPFSDVPGYLGCIDCGKMLPESEFYFFKTAQTFDNHCKTCRAWYSREHRKGGEMEQEQDWAQVPAATANLQRKAQRRRTALSRAGCSTYAIGRKSGVTCIVCLCCGMGSANPNDIREKYCGFCCDWHSEEREP